jgi:hypothetical protein
MLVRQILRTLVVAVRMMADQDLVLTAAPFPFRRATGARDPTVDGLMAEAAAAMANASTISVGT